MQAIVRETIVFLVIKDNTIASIAGMTEINPIVSMVLPHFSLIFPLLYIYYRLIKLSDLVTVAGGAGSSFWSAIPRMSSGRIHGRLCRALVSSWVR